MKLDREHFERAARFYSESPTGQYDDEAAHALRNHFALVAALERLLGAASLSAARGEAFAANSPGIVSARAALAAAKGEAP